MDNDNNNHGYNNYDYNSDESDEIVDEDGNVLAAIGNMPPDSMTQHSLPPVLYDGSSEMRLTIDPKDIDIDVERHPWDKQPGETAKEYAMFVTYASLPNSTRTLKQTTRIYSGKPGAVNTETARAAARKNNWIERAAAWDVEKLRRKEQQWLERDASRREQDYNVGEKLRAKAIEALDYIDEDELRDPKNIARMLELASNLQQAAVPPTRLEADHVKQILSRLPDDRRKVVVELLMARVQNL